METLLRLEECPECPGEGWQRDRTLVCSAEVTLLVLLARATPAQFVSAKLLGHVNTG
jgi:hypothetical protein